MYHDSVKQLHTRAIDNKQLPDGGDGSAANYLTHLDAERNASNPSKPKQKSIRYPWTLGPTGTLSD